MEGNGVTPRAYWMYWALALMMFVIAQYFSVKWAILAALRDYVKGS